MQNLLLLLLPLRAALSSCAPPTPQKGRTEPSGLCRGSCLPLLPLLLLLQLLGLSLQRQGGPRQQPCLLLLLLLLRQLSKLPARLLLRIRSSDLFSCCCRSETIRKLEMNLLQRRSY